MTTDQKREILEAVIERMDECAELVRSLGDAWLDRSCLAEFEGRRGGWLGGFVRDEIEGALANVEDDE